MSLVGVCSAHGSPGVTTVALALGAVWSRGEPVVVEADPFGGVLAARFGLSDSPGLVSLAAAARPSLSVEGLASNVQRLPGDLQVVPGVASPEQGYRVFHDVASPLIDVAGGADAAVDVLVDAGRVPVSGDPGPLLAGCDLVLVVARPVVEQLRLAAHRVHRLAGVAHTGVLLVGDAPYGPAEVAEALGVDVVGAVAWDPVGAALMNGTSATMFGTRARSRLARSLLARSTRTLTEPLFSRLGITAGTVSVGGGL